MSNLRHGYVTENWRRLILKISNLSLVIIVLLCALTFVGVGSALVHSGNTVTGGGQLVNPLGKEVWKTFNAHIDKDGNVNGQFQNQGGNSGTWHADVTDLTVVDNTAIIEYHVTFAPDNPSILGQTQCVIVIDNGEGKNAVPDQISQSYLADESGCDDPPSRPMMDLIDGNIQVH